jgi:hypothetical protein
MELVEDRLALLLLLPLVYDDGVGRDYDVKVGELRGVLGAIRTIEDAYVETLRKLFELLLPLVDD